MDYDKEIEKLEGQLKGIEAAYLKCLGTVEYLKAEKNKIIQKIPPQTRRQLDLISEKGASSWLTSLPLKEYGFILNKQEFHDAIYISEIQPNPFDTE